VRKHRKFENENEREIRDREGGKWLFLIAADDPSTHSKQTSERESA
jgi:hypothetical protein